jgi:hypothetical protein
MFSHISLALTAALLLSTAFASKSADVNVLYNFGNSTWAENLAVRANGQILVSRLDKPEILQVDPTGANSPITVASWDSPTMSGCLGISETTPDMFYVITDGVYNADSVLTSGVNSIWEIDMSTFAVSKKTGAVVSNATVSKLVDITTSGLLNGLTTLTDHTILAADSHNGWVYHINTHSGDYKVAINDEKMKFDYFPNPTLNIGVNGIKVYDGHLYWTNTAAGTLNRIGITGKGTPVGKSEILANNVPKADDFVIRSDGTAFIAQNQVQGNELSVLYPKSHVAHVIAGSNTSTIVTGVSAGKFGRLQNDKHILYLTTGSSEFSQGFSSVPIQLMNQ